METERHSTEHLPDYSEIACLMQKARFQYRTLHEANLLAQFIAKACPNPRMSVVGICELLVNAVEHGNLGITAEEKDKLQHDNKWIEEIEKRLSLSENLAKMVEVEIELDRSENELKITVVDQGKGFDWEKLNQSHEEEDDRLATHGRGIWMAKKLVFKRLEYSGNGNVVIGVIDLKK